MPLLHYQKNTSIWSPHVTQWWYRIESISNRYRGQQKKIKKHYLLRQHISISMFPPQNVTSWWDSKFEPGANPTSLEFTATKPGLWYARAFFKVGEKIFDFKAQQATRVNVYNAGVVIRSLRIGSWMLCSLGGCDSSTAPMPHGVNSFLKWPLPLDTTFVNTVHMNHSWSG
jgi:hypothetical protein